MMTPKIKEQCRPTYHRDGTVSYWDVYLQQWARRPAQEVTEAVQASHDDVFRRRVANMAAQYHRACAERCIAAVYVEDVDGCIVTRGEDPETGNRYAFLYRSGGAAFAELWRDLPEQTDYLWRALPTPLGMMAAIRQAITERLEVAQ